MQLSQPSSHQSAGISIGSRFFLDTNTALVDDILEYILEAGEENYQEFMLSQYKSQHTDIVLLIEEHHFFNNCHPYQSALLLRAQRDQEYCRGHKKLHIHIHDDKDEICTTLRRKPLVTLFPAFIEMVKSNISLKKTLGLDDTIKLIHRFEYVKFAAIADTCGECYIMFNANCEHPCKDTEIIYIRDICQI
jgi:hypothetical protein